MGGQGVPEPAGRLPGHAPEARPIAPGRGVGEVGRGVNAHRDEHEKYHRQPDSAPHVDGEGGHAGGLPGGRLLLKKGLRHLLAQFGGRGLGAGAVLRLPPVPGLEDHAQQPQQGQPGPGIHHRPLGGAADAPEQAAQKQGQNIVPQLLPRRDGQPAVHEIVRHQDEEHAVGVDGGDAGLDQVHEVEGEQRRAAQGHRGLAEQVLQEHVEDGHHQHAEQGSHKPPAEGHHAKHHDAQGQNELAQGWVGHLVGVDVVQMLVGGAGVVDLVKIGGVHIGVLVRPQLVFVEQGGRALVHVIRDGVEHGACLLFADIDFGIRPAPQGQLGQPQPLLPGRTGRGDTEAGGGDGAQRLCVQIVVILGDLQAVLIDIAPQIQHPPLEQGVVGLIQPQAVPCSVLPLPLQGVVPGAQGGIVGDGVHGDGLAVGELIAVPPLELHRRLGGVEVPQLEKGGEGVHRREQQKGQHIPPLHGVAGQGEGHAAGLGALLRHGDPFQAVGPGAQAVPVVHEKGGAQGDADNRPGKGGGQVGEKPGDAVRRRVPDFPEGGRRASLRRGRGGQSQCVDHRGLLFRRAWARLIGQDGQKCRYI